LYVIEAATFGCPLFDFGELFRREIGHEK
jgi:hypothetical protein